MSSSPFGVINQPQTERASKGGFWDWICKVFRVVVGKRPGSRGCIYIPERIINRPDPCIYDQFLLMQLGQPVTWANPDFSIMLGGVPQYTYGLTVSTTYDIHIKVHNSSRQKPALGTTINVHWLEFGVGGQVNSHPIGTFTADVPVWPGTCVVHVPWTTPAIPGHYCLQAELFHPEDGNPANNLGQNNTQVCAAHSEVRDQIRIFNQFLNESTPPTLAPSVHRAPRNHVEITVDGYIFHDAIGKDADPSTMFAPKDAAWPARVEPTSFDFATGEAYRDVTLIVDAPHGAGPAETFNVTARQDGTPLGGVTIVIERGT
jgi:hypothetical protein